MIKGILKQKPSTDVCSFLSTFKAVFYLDENPDKIHNRLK